MFSVKYQTFQVVSSTYVAYFDTAVSTIQMPLADLLVIFNIMLPNYDWSTGLYTIPCDKIDEKATLDLGFDGAVVEYSIDPVNFIVDLDLDDGQCAIAMEVEDELIYPIETHVFGTPLFRQFCVTIDLDANSIILYDHAHS
ncbi:Peptidase A1 domain-containing protein [Aphelenchoides bicaudatus]|nr:Peptidase A1 domain-containing protein [Aphelenchoides bicaudatus]